MNSASFPATSARGQRRYDLRSLTYVTLDEANGGIIRNLTHQGVAVQAVGALRAHQQVRVRFELRYPRLRVETRGEVMWANTTGQCGIRFLDLAPQMTFQINEWIFGSLLQSIAPHSTDVESIFDSVCPGSRTAQADDGLIVSPSARQAIRLTSPAQSIDISRESNRILRAATGPVDMTNENWPERIPNATMRSPLLSARSIAWAVDSLIMVAAFLLFSLVFLSITHELPQWPLSLAVALSAAVFVPGFYCVFFYMLGGPSLGSRLARLAVSEVTHEPEADDRFR